MNRPSDARRAKYHLLHSVRSHLGCEDDAFGCMGNGEDAEGVKGVFLRRNVVNVAGRALKYNLTRLGPLVLPYSELVGHIDSAISSDRLWLLLECFVLKSCCPIKVTVNHIFAVPDNCVFTLTGPVLPQQGVHARL
jgi:3-ketoacyl-CoA synthase